MPGVDHSTPPAWYPDPTGRFEYRYHNGVAWTADVSSGGVRAIDPAGTAPRGPAWSGATPTPPQRRDRLATACLVLGIVGICLAWVPVLFVAGGVCAVLAIVLGVVAHRRRPRDTRGFIGAGLATGVGALALVAVGVWTTSLVFDAIDRFEHPPAHSVEITECTVGETGRVTVAGVLTNEGSRGSEFRVVVLLPTGSNQRREVSLNVGEVAAGTIGDFRHVFRVAGASEGGVGSGCPVVRVTGPFPFGVEIDV